MVTKTPWILTLSLKLFFNRYIQVENMIVMIVTTRNFEFIGLGNDEDEAAKGLLARWKKHCANAPGADAAYMQELIGEGSAQVVEVEPGSAVIYGLDG